MTGTLRPRIRIEELQSVDVLTIEESNRILGAGPKRTLGIEQLEGRELPAASLTASFSAGVLRVEGTNAADVIAIRQVDGRMQVEGVPIRDVRGVVVAPPTSTVQSIRVDALGGEDLIWVGGNPAVPAHINSGAGRDLVVMGPSTTLATARDAADQYVASQVARIWQQLDTVRRNAQGEYPLGSVQLGIASLTNVTVKVNGQGLTLTGTANLPVIGSTRLSGTVSADQKSFSLSAPGVQEMIGQFSLANAIPTLTERGLSLRGSTNLPVVGTVNWSGNIQANGTYTLTATAPGRALLDGVVQLQPTQLTLSQGKVTMTANATIAQIGQATFVGTLNANGTYSIKAKAAVNVAGFQVPGADFALGSDELDAAFTLPVPGVGPVQFGGSYGPGGQWSVTGTVPTNIPIGPVVLKQIRLTVASDHLTLGALGTIAGVQGVVDAQATATIYKDGRTNLNVDARALSVGGFALGNAEVNVSNTNPQRLYILTMKGTVGVPSGPNVNIQGVMDANGNYELTGTQTVGIGGINMSNAQFKLNKTSGLTFSGTMSNFGYNVTMSGTAQASGQVTMRGTGSLGVGGFNIGTANFTAEANAATRTYRISAEGTANVLVGNVRFTGTATGNGSTFSTPTFTGTASIGGALSRLFSGTATFTSTSSGVNFSGNLTLVGIGTSANITGSVRPDGTITINNQSFNLSSLANMASEAVAKVLSSAGASLASIGQRLNSLGGRTLTEIAGALGSISRDAGAIAGVLRNQLNGSIDSVANALYRGIGWTTYANVATGLGAITRDAGAIAGALRNQLSVAYNTIADVMYRNISWTTYATVATGLGAITRDAAVIAGALRNELNVAYNTIADVMYRNISWTTYANVATGLGSITRDATVIAGALRNGLSVSFNTIADVMYRNISWTTYANVATGLGSVTRDMSAIANAMRSSLSVSFNTLANVLYNNISWTTTSDVARGLGAVTRDVGAIASALRSQLNISYNTVANIMYNAISWTTYTDVANGLKAITNDARVIADALHRGAGMAQSAVSSVINSISSGLSNVSSVISSISGSVSWPSWSLPW